MPLPNFTLTALTVELETTVKPEPTALKTRILWMLEITRERAAGRRHHTKPTSAPLSAVICAARVDKWV